jgi:YHS domain-containing protein
MFVDVEVRVNMPAAIAVPADAVIDSGRQKAVYVDLGNGNFEPRAIKTGWRLADRVQVAEGLEPGERIVVSGNFLIDSESRMKMAPRSDLPAVTSGKDPVCGMDADLKAADAIQIQLAGRIYTFCSEKCRREFQARITNGVAKQQPAPADHARGTE